MTMAEYFCRKLKEKLVLNTRYNTDLYQNIRYIENLVLTTHKKYKILFLRSNYTFHLDLNICKINNQF